MAQIMKSNPGQASLKKDSLKRMGDIPSVEGGSPIGREDQAKRIPSWPFSSRDVVLSLALRLKLIHRQWWKREGSSAP